MYKKIKNKIKLLILIFISIPIWNWSFRSSVLVRHGIKIGPNSLVGDSFYFSGDATTLIIGENVYINTHFYAQCAAPIEIEDWVRIGPFVKVLTRYHPIEEDEIRRVYGRDNDIPKRIGRGSWIGIGAIILPGVDIAPGCVIAAGAVVAKTTEPNGLYAGVPAKRIKDLPTEKSWG